MPLGITIERKNFSSRHRQILQLNSHQYIQPFPINLLCTTLSIISNVIPSNSLLLSSLTIIL